MIEFKTGNLFDSECQTLVNATNIQGVMGAGIAKAFKERFPEMFWDYRHACKAGEHTATQPHFWAAPTEYDIPGGRRINDVPNVLNIATTPLMGDEPKLSLIAINLAWLILNYEEWGITSIALPALGCGIGGGDWDQMKALLVSFLELLDIPVEIYEPL